MIDDVRRDGPAHGRAPGRLPVRVGVVGGGRMGSGIGHAFLTCGSQVLIVETDADRAAAAREATGRAVATSVRLGTATGSVQEIMRRLRVVTDRAELAGSALVIEAVPEDREIKHQVLQAISAIVDGAAIIASNTSSFAISGLAGAVSRPQRFLGLHFFNPVPASRLVEVVIGPGTGEAAANAARQWVSAIGKTAVTVADSPGFASSRLGVLLGLEAIRMVEQGVASVRDIDAAMTLGYQHPVGPLELTDRVGLHVRLGVAEYLAGALGERFAPPQLLRDMVARGELGRQAGRGFYEWRSDGTREPREW